MSGKENEPCQPDDPNHDIEKKEKKVLKRLKAKGIDPTPIEGESFEDYVRRIVFPNG